MRDYSLDQVFAILIDRVRRRADALERVRLDGFNQAVEELRRFAEMLERARSYVIARETLRKP